MSKITYQEFSHDGKSWVRLYEERDGTLYDYTNGIYDPNTFDHRRTVILETVTGPEPVSDREVKK